MNEDFIPVLAEMRLYYTECAENAMPGSRAERKFTGYYAALDQAIARLSKNEPPVTHCTACKHWDQNSGLTARKCCKHGIITKQFDYCSYGEAK